MQKKLYITSDKDRNKGPANNYDTANVTGLVSLVHDICKQRQSKKVWLYMIVRHRFFWRDVEYLHSWILKLGS